MIIDCHGHYTTAPAAHQDYRNAQLAAFNAGRPLPKPGAVSDDEIRESVEANQLKLLRERGADMTIFSPRASAMAHHVGDAQVSEKHCNFLINRGAATATEIEELGEDVRRRVKAHSGIALQWEIKRVGKAP